MFRNHIWLEIVDHFVQKAIRGNADPNFHQTVPLDIQVSAAKGTLQDMKLKRFIKHFSRKERKLQCLPVCRKKIRPSCPEQCAKSWGTGLLGVEKSGGIIFERTEQKHAGTIGMLFAYLLGING